MLSEKKRLSLADLDAQAAFELPNREMMLITVVITNPNILSNNTTTVDVRNNNVAVQVCAAVDAINTILPLAQPLTCTIGQ